MSDMDENLSLWTRYTKGVKRIHKPTAKPAPKVKKPEGSAAIAKKITECFRKHENSSKAKPLVAAPLPQAATDLFDWRTERKIKKGDVEIDGKLDLHGMTQKDAHSALINFIEKKSRTGARRLLIVTGKGRAGESVLRKNLPRWCEAAPISKLILTLRPAAIKHGGDGAFYVMLRQSKG